MIKNLVLGLVISLLVASKVQSFPTSSLVEYDRAEELAGKFEGDIELTIQQKSSIESLNGLQSVTNRWASKIVPYAISDEFSKSHKMLLIIVDS